MANIDPVSQTIKSPGTLTLGTASASAIQEIITGTAAITFPAAIALNGGIASASAAVIGLTSAFQVFAQAQSWAAATGNNIVLAGWAGIAGGIQCTALNVSSVSGSPASATFSFFAIR